MRHKFQELRDKDFMPYLKISKPEEGATNKTSFIKSVNPFLYYLFMKSAFYKILSVSYKYRQRDGLEFKTFEFLAKRQK